MSYEDMSIEQLQAALQQSSAERAAKRVEERKMAAVLDRKTAAANVAADIAKVEQKHNVTIGVQSIASAEAVPAPGTS